MKKEIYGANADEKITPLVVRDAIVNCFFEAHCEDAGIMEEDKASNKEYCQSIVRKAFEDTGGDFDHPTKESIMKVMGQLAEFSKSFRDPKVIEKHYMQIKGLVDKL